MTTERTLSDDLRELAAWIDADNCKDSERRELARWLNAKLDELLSEDAFGTEGQCDPRGDHRD